GAIDEDSYRRAEEILTTFSKDKIIKVRNMRTAETVTLLKIIYQDVKKALANEISELCEKMRIDFMEVMHSANAQLKSQIPPPGIVEEHYSKDPYLLISEAESLRVKLRVVSASRKVNETVYKRVLKLLRDAIRSCGKTASRARVLILGLSSIPNLKNIEGSPVRQLISTLQRKGMSIRVYDPLFSYKELLEMGYETERSLLQAARDTDCIIIAVGHDRFKRLSLKRLKMVMRKPAAIVDLDHVLNYKEAEREGFIYRGLGRGVWSR
ncbi:TPA: hypothetical protein EYP70_02935, partial [Candidatus Bathyarchaeota archaeon]|nr:hypothetical protein [Candidatus Bathyarchaeota archaeon]